jgi:isocitrate dehydrogenase kinase/phosphatase
MRQHPDDGVGFSLEKNKHNPSQNLVEESGRALIDDTVASVIKSFEDYNNEFGAITRRSRRRFEEREWKLGQRDAVERIELYDHRVAWCVAGLVGRMGSRIADQATWREIRVEYACRIQDRTDAEFFKTFFNSLTRKVFNTVGVNPEVEFLASDLEPTLNGSSPPTQNFPVAGDFEDVIKAILAQFPSTLQFPDLEKSAGQVVAAVTRHQTRSTEYDIEAVDILTPVFYRATRAFIVGRIKGVERVAPMILAIKNTGKNISVDAVITSSNEVRSLFGFSRSYFHADLPAVSATVNFLKSIMPVKPIDELYSVLGRAKQAKTERYRQIYKHQTTSDDAFIHAEGHRGMVMIVFTQPSRGLVFKVIRDRFPYPKTTSRAAVMDRYQFVFKHDRVGRLVDAQEFRRLRFEKSRFSPELLEELLGEATQSCRMDGDDVIIEHCYIERRLRPLNLFLDEADKFAATRAVVDYGQAIKDLARSNVFPGDLLLKNFGVTRHGRIIFYDYDELCLVTDCSFRDLPESRFEEDELRAEPWFYVGPHDIFPEQFINFLGLSADLRAVFLEHHADLLTADFWRGLKACHQAEQLLEVVPYAQRSSISNVSVAA